MHFLLISETQRVAVFVSPLKLFKICTDFDYFSFETPSGGQFTLSTQLMMAVNIWKSYICTADKDVNMKVIFAVMNTT